MIALTLTQPWASFVALGEKRIETRSWSTNYRGTLAIHSAKTFPRWARDLCHEDPFRTVINARNLLYRDSLPLGYIIATARLVDVISTNGPLVDAMLDGGAFPEHEEELGDYGPDRFAWVLDDVMALARPVAAKGSSGLWELTTGRRMVVGGTRIEPGVTGDWEENGGLRDDVMTPIDDPRIKLALSYDDEAVST